MTLKSTHKNTHTENKHPSQNLKYCVVYPLPFSGWGRQMTKTLQTITVAFPSPACQVSLTKQVQWNSLKCHLEGLPGNRYCLCNSVIPQINRHAHDWKIILSTASLHLSLAAAFFVCYQVFLHKDFTDIELKKKTYRGKVEAVCACGKHTERLENNLWKMWVWNAPKIPVRRVVPETKWSI